ncbi:MAG: hypothetical protein M0R68_03970 [Bacteroidetes bacterium]|nr:hypothetical protein [Bacteroidota bacterium]
MKILPLYRSATGLADKLDAMRVVYNAETGVLGLSQANDITIDLSGAIKSRPGFSLLQSGYFSNLFSCGEYGLCEYNGNLCLINENLSIAQLVPVYTNQLAYAQVFNNVQDCVYFSDGVQTGVLRDKVYSPWNATSYVGVQSTEMQAKRFAAKIPAGHIICVFNGVMYIAYDNLVIPSEPFSYTWFDLEKTFAFDSRITMIASVISGLYISTQSRVYFLAGATPKLFSRKIVLDSGVVEGTVHKHLGSALGLQTGNEVLTFVTKNSGLCIATEDGAVTSYSDTHVNCPEGKRGSSYVFDHNLITSILY